MKELTPKQTVQQLDRYIVGQNDAKRAVAIAIRNRWRRQQLPEGMREEVGPKNIIRITSYNVCYTKLLRFSNKILFISFKMKVRTNETVRTFSRINEALIRLIQPRSELVVC